MREKDVNLAVALLVRDNIKQLYPHVNIVMTRSDDRFIALHERAKIANRKNADLFISIHANAARSAQASGTETYVLGLWRTEDNLRVAMRENQVIELEENYEATYHGFDPNSVESYIQFELMKDQHLDKSILAATCIQSRLGRLPLVNRDVRQAGFLVIREISMPGILIELGFLTNTKDRAYLNSKKGQRALAEAITTGFGEYYTKQGGVKASTPRTEVTTASDEELEKEEKVADNEHIVNSSEDNDFSTQKEYRIQIASISTKEKKLSTKDSWFKGLDVQVTQEGARYVYTVGSSHSLQESKQKLTKLKKRYKDAYIAVYENGKRVGSIY